MDSNRSESGLDIGRRFPVLFVLLIIIYLFTCYTYFHCYPLLQIGEKHKNKDDVFKGTWRLSLFLGLTVMILVCYIRSIITPAGGIPDTPEWTCGVETEPLEIPANVQETKGDGGRRKCKWCGKYKPDRCHHCRVCRVCVLKMDHHCPWIFNCVGFANHKYFFLLLFYSTAGTHLISWTMWETVKETTEVETEFWKMFVILFCETLAVFIGIIISTFFLFHIYLMLQGMTTIEYCEKQMKKENYNRSIWDLGVYGNMKAVFGSNIFLWLLPLSPPEGNGINYVTERSRLTVDIEAGKGLRKQHINETRRRQMSGRNDNSSDSNPTHTNNMDSEFSMQGEPGSNFPRQNQNIMWTPRRTSDDSGFGRERSGQGDVRQSNIPGLGYTGLTRDRSDDYLSGNGAPRKN